MKKSKIFGSMMPQKFSLDTMESQLPESAVVAEGGDSNTASNGKASGRGVQFANDVNFANASESYSQSGSMIVSRSKGAGSRSRGSVSTTSWRQLKKDFISEMRYLSKLRHPCITTVMGAVMSSGQEPMLVMEYMEVSHWMAAHFVSQKNWSVDCISQLLFYLRF